uniref:Uncharacterized protein n=1 Tax=Gadus morhua TaxID=8049 RepID=A0A8C5BSQ1_GADMO
CGPPGPPPPAWQRTMASTTTVTRNTKVVALSATMRYSVTLENSSVLWGLMMRRGSGAGFWGGSITATVMVAVDDSAGWPWSRTSTVSEKEVELSSITRRVVRTSPVCWCTLKRSASLACCSTYTSQALGPASASYATTLVTSVPGSAFFSTVSVEREALPRVAVTMRGTWSFWSMT